jgi:hypothetical protein
VGRGVSTYAASPAPTAEPGGRAARIAGQPVKSWNNVENPCSARIAVCFDARQFLAGPGNSRLGYGRIGDDMFGTQVKVVNE